SGREPRGGRILRADRSPRSDELGRSATGRALLRERTHRRRSRTVPREQGQVPQSRPPSGGVDQTAGALILERRTYAPGGRGAAGRGVRLPLGRGVSRVDAEPRQRGVVAQVDDPSRLDLDRQDRQLWGALVPVGDHRGRHPLARGAQVQGGGIWPGVAADGARPRQGPIGEGGVDGPVEDAVHAAESTLPRFLTVLLGAVGAAAAALCVAVLIAQALRVARRLSAAIPGARPPRWPAPPPPAAGGRTPGRRYRP